MRIFAAGDYCEAVHADPPDLKALVKNTVGTHVRRIGRFIQLALIGAGRCVGGAAIPTDTAVYLASARGDLEVTLEVLEQLFRQGHPPKPLSFINTVSNAACFYVAQHLQLQSASSFVCNRYFAFESALQLAMLDLNLGRVNSALVGVVDVVVHPLTRHRKHLGLAADAVGEASHWLWLGNSSSQNDMGASVLDAQHFPDRNAFVRWYRSIDLGTDTVMSAGQFLRSEDWLDLQRELGISQSFDYRRERPYYDSQSSAAVSEFMRSGSNHRQLLHVNTDWSGRFSAFLVRKDK